MERSIRSDHDVWRPTLETGRLPFRRKSVSPYMTSTKYEDGEDDNLKGVGSGNCFKASSPRTGPMNFWRWCRDG